MKKVISYSHFYDLYALLLFLCLFIVAPFGIFPSFSAYSKKQEVLQKLQNESTRLDQALRDARDMRYLEEDVTPYLLGLETAVPTGFYGDEFLNEIASLTSTFGYAVRSISFNPNPSSNTVNISLSVEGPFSTLQSFLNSMEESAFSILVDSFTVSFGQRESSDNQTINFQLRVFSLLENNL